MIVPSFVLTKIVPDELTYSSDHIFDVVRVDLVEETVVSLVTNVSDYCYTFLNELIVDSGPGEFRVQAVNRHLFRYGNIICSAKPA